MILSAHQPAYLPWLGYFEKLIRSDVFVFMDTVQYEKNSYINRNRIKTAQGPIWLTIPVKSKGHITSSLLETEIDNRQHWKEKHLKSIWLNYKKAPRFDYCYPRLETLYAEEDELLADLCFRHLAFWLEEINVERRIVRLGTLPIDSRKSDLVFDICKYFGADRYISGALGMNYLDENKFDAAGIRIEYQVYKQPVYQQLHGEFMPNLSILDFWMNTDRLDLIMGEV